MPELKEIVTEIKRLSPALRAKVMQWYTSFKLEQSPYYGSIAAVRGTSRTVAITLNQYIIHAKNPPYPPNKGYMKGSLKDNGYKTMDINKKQAAVSGVAHLFANPEESTYQPIRRSSVIDWGTNKHAEDKPVELEFDLKSVLAKVRQLNPDMRAWVMEQYTLKKMGYTKSLSNYNAALELELLVSKGEMLQSLTLSLLVGTDEAGEET